jgi:hypothetical protein
MWARNYERCIKCGTVDIRHRARGLCAKCYEKDNYNRYNPHKGQQWHRGQYLKILTKQYLEEEYLNKKRSINDIAKTVGCTKMLVSYKMSKYGIPRRSQASARALALSGGKLTYIHTNKLGKEDIILRQKRVVNENFFSSWSKEMAWVLGIVFTDGYIDPGKQENPLRKTSQTTAIMSIGQKEPELLIKVAGLMGSNAFFHIRPDGVHIYSLSSNKIYKDLIDIGLTPHKSLTVTFPSVPAEYVSHFIRGCWDGDGSIGFYDGHYLARFFSGSLSFIETLVNHITSAGLPQRKIYVNSAGHKEPYYSVNFKGKITAKLYEYLYRDANPSCYLERKYKLFRDAYNKQYRYRTKLF